MEAMIAAFVLAIGLVAVLQLFSSSLKNSLESRDRIIASGLSQEGVELVRNIRDNNILNGDDAFQDIGATGSLTDQKIDVSDPTLSSSANFSDKMLLYDNSGSVDIYQHTGGGDDSNYYRQIDVIFDNKSTLDPDDDELTVNGMVVWKTTSFPIDYGDCTIANKCIFTTSTLTRWQE